MDWGRGEPLAVTGTSDARLYDVQGTPVKVRSSHHIRLSVDDQVRLGHEVIDQHLDRLDDLPEEHGCRVLQLNSYNVDHLADPPRLKIS